MGLWVLKLHAWNSMLKPSKLIFSKDWRSKNGVKLRKWSSYAYQYSTLQSWTQHCDCEGNSLPVIKLAFTFSAKASRPRRLINEGFALDTSSSRSRWRSPLPFAIVATTSLLQWIVILFSVFTDRGCMFWRRIHVSDISCASSNFAWFCILQTDPWSSFGNRGK